jgi:hypothetical protein
MLLYHLSPRKGLQFIVPSNAEQTPATITPRVPEDSPGEDQKIKRVCVAPTVRQCVLAIGRVEASRTYHIYKMDIPSSTNPAAVSPLPPEDWQFTGERWITDQEVEECGGRIELTYRGYVRVTDKMEWQLRQLEEDPDWVFDEGGEWSLPPTV